MGRLVVTLVLGMAAVGCSEVYADTTGSDGLCLHWTDEGPIAADAKPAATMACAVSASVVAFHEQLGKEPPLVPMGDYQLKYTCAEMPALGVCPGVPEAEREISACVEQKEGDACDHFGGTCTTTYIWSLCGSDPAAVGACCYYAYVVTSLWIS